MAITVEVQNLKCGGCANTIIRTLSEEFPGVSVDVEGKKVTVEEGSEELLKARLRGLGYPPAGEEAGMVSKAKSFVSCATGKFDLKL